MLRPQRSLGVQALTLAIGSGIAQILVAILYIVTARSVGPAEFGIVAMAVTVGLAGSTFADLATSPYWIRELASDRITQDKLNPRMTTHLCIVLSISFLTILVAIIQAPKFIASGAILFSASIASTSLVPLRAARKADYVGWITILGRLVAVAFFFGLTASGVDADQSLWCSIVAGDFALALSAYVITPRRLRIKLTFRLRINPWEGARWYSVIALCRSARQLDLPIVGAIAGSAAAGVYGGVNRWIQPMLIATSAFSSAAAPFIARETDFRRLRGPVLRATPLLALPLALSIGLIVFADWLVPFLLGAEYSESAPVLQWLAAAMILNIAGQPMLIVLQARRFDHMAAGIFLVSVVVQLTTVAALASTIGALGAGIGFFVCQALQFIGAAICLIVIVSRRTHGIRSLLNR